MTESKKELEFSYDIFFLGPESYGEHIQVKATDIEALSAGRKKMIEWLQKIGATTLPRDVLYGKKTAVDAAKEVFGRITEDLGECPDCGSALAKRRRRDGSGSFIGCTNFPECKYIARN